ncbi:MAG: hypothetical protein VB064_12965 [Oscillospiraceae bacterium]|nr:hypothetical protein [Oscillospiraceae bacterium]
MPSNLNTVISNIVIPSVSAILGILATIYVFFKSNNKDLARERLDKVLFPLMDKLEPVLYKLSADEGFMFLMNEAKQILDQNKMLSGNKLYEEFRLFNDAKENDHKFKEERYKSFSNLLINEYNAACRKIGLPIISSQYRLRHKLYTTTQFVITLVGYILFSMLIFAFFMFAFLLVLAVIMIITGNVPSA